MTVVVALLIAAADPAAAYKDLDRSAGDEARTRVSAVVQSLTGFGMPRSASVLLAALAADRDQSEGLRAAARAQLAARAGEDPALVQLLLADMTDPGKLPPALAVAIARGHLERALQIAPPEEGAAFETLLQQGPSVQAASAESVPRPLDKELASAMGQPAAEPAPAPAPVPQKIPAAAQRELDAARALAASVPAGDAAEGDAREIAGLAALASGDAAGATKEFLAVAALPVRRGDGVAAQRRDQAYMQLARLAYQNGDDALAAKLYERVGRGAPEWLDALFESSWAQFRRGEDEKALGNLLTLHAPFFQDRFFPECPLLSLLSSFRIILF